MILKTRAVAIATALIAVLALGLIGWQIARGPSGEPATSSTVRASGLVSPAPPEPDTRPVAGPAAAPLPASTPASAPASSAVATTRQAIKPAIKHRVAPSGPALPPILPHEVNRALAQALGSSSYQALSRWVYLDPLARRFVASVDRLAEPAAPKTLWLLRPAPGALKLATSRKQPDTPLIARANSQRYARFLRWVEATDTQRLLQLYARMYPLLQQSYVELGHPDGYFNDRLIEVIDLLLATPASRAPLRVRLQQQEVPTLGATPPPKPRYEFEDPALESLATGQKILLRMGPENAARLKLKLKALRQGLIRLAGPNRQR